MVTWILPMAHKVRAVRVHVVLQVRRLRPWGLRT